MPKYIVNKGGTVHSVAFDHPFYEETRPATSDEIAGWYTEQGLEVPDEIKAAIELAAADKAAAAAEAEALKKGK